MKYLNNLINREKDTDSCFVFPSETAASQWRRYFIDITEKKAVRNDRFVSWDRFKEGITLHTRKEKPVNSILRRLFAADLIYRNSKDPALFNVIVPVQFRENAGAFTETISQILPELDSWLKYIDSKSGELKDEILKDYQRLHQEYVSFLSLNGLFEPSWEDPEIKFSGRKYFIIYPDLIEDFEEFRQLLDREDCVIFNETENQQRIIRQFDNSVVEVDAVLQEIRDLLNDGVDYSEIAVTCADKFTEEVLREKALLSGVPVIFRSGKTLAEYPAGRLPELIKSCTASGYSIGAMKNLLLYKAFNWKEPDKAANLVRFGIEHRCLKNTSMKPSDDEWAVRLKNAGEYVLLDFYKKLKKRIQAIERSRSFAVLAKEFQVFISTFLDTDSDNWGPESEQVFQRTREVLAELRETEAVLRGVEITDPPGLWIQALKNKIYVRQEPGSGIQVYPYRVSALINPQFHFIIGLTNENAAAVSKPFGFLTDKARKEAGLEERVMTDDFISLYSVSGADVRFSCSSETSRGAALPPGWFVEKELLQEVHISSEAAAEGGVPVQAENLWWSEVCNGNTQAAKQPPRVGKLQLEGFKYAAATFMQPKGFDACGSAFPDGEEKNILEYASTDEDGNIRVSASALNQWAECRFSFFLNRVLQISEEEYVLKTEDPLTAGNILHEILFVFFDRLRTGGGSLNSTDLDRYPGIMHSAAEEVFSRREKDPDVFFGPAWPAFKRKALSQLMEFPAAEVTLYDGYKPVMLEEWLSHVDKDLKIKAVGKVDRISTHDGEAVIVDYKKSWEKKTAARYISRDEDGRLMPPAQGFQLPFYFILASGAGFNVRGTTYYGVAQHRHFPVSGPGGVIDDKEVEDLCELTRVFMAEMADSIRKGEYTAPGRCGGCSFRSICRKRFNIKWSRV